MKKKLLTNIKKLTENQVNGLFYSLCFVCLFGFITVFAYALYHMGKVMDVGINEHAALKHVIIAILNSFGAWGFGNLLIKIIRLFRLS